MARPKPPKRPRPFTKLKDRGHGMPALRIKRDEAILHSKALRVIADGASSKADVARALRWSPSKVSRVVAQLVKGGSIQSDFTLTRRGAGRLRFPILI